METRASYLIVGAVVLALLAGLATFSVWLVQTDVDREAALYEIAFSGSVSGLQESGQVLYRGIPVGRVADIRIDPEDVERVLVLVEIERDTPIKEDTIATLQFQGITGIAYVQLHGGTQASAELDPDAKTPPRIRSRRSALERVFESTPELLVRALGVIDRVNLLLADDNLEAVAGTLANLETLSGVLAGRADGIDAVLASAADVTGEVKLLATDLRQLTAKLDQRVDGVGEDVVTTLAELQGVAAALTSATARFDRMLGKVEQPVDDFAATGLYEFTQLIGETRLLVAAISRISKEFERDPAGFLIGRTSRGYQPE